MTGANALPRGRDAILEGQEAIRRYDVLFGAIRRLVPDALEQAEASDELIRDGHLRSPLEGVPVIVKDNIDVSGLSTTAGALALAGSVPSGDAHVVERLRAAGAVILAKANLSELANFLTEGMASGYSSLGGQVLNPYDLSVTPSGSSSGSAAAVALGYAPLAVGTETNGSIISPSVHQSLVGVKPTLGLVSRHGIFPIAPSQDTAGPMSTTVAGAAALLAAMAGPDHRDAATVGPDSEARRVANELADWAPDPDALRSVRLGLVATREGARPVPGELVSALTAAGATVEDVSLPGATWDDQLFVLRYEFAPAVDAYFSDWPAGIPIRSLAALQEWNLAHADVALKFGQTQVDAAVAIDHEAERDRYLEARRRDVSTTVAALEEAMSSCDVLVFRGDDGADWAARPGWPSVTVPIGYSPRSRRPRAVTLVGRPWTDAALLTVAAAVEATCGHRLPPREVNPAIFTARGW